MSPRLPIIPESERLSVTIKTGLVSPTTVVNIIQGSDDVSSDGRYINVPTKYQS